jgi:hypothetical protein
MRTLWMKAQRAAHRRELLANWLALLALLAVGIVLPR